MMAWDKTDDDIDIGDICEFVGGNLPEGWEFRWRFWMGETNVDLIDPEGNSVEICSDDLTTQEYIRALVNHARLTDGLEAVTFAGEHDPIWPDRH